MDTKSTLANLDEVTKQLKVTIPAERVKREVDDALLNLGRRAKIKGFRPGKAPRHLLEKMHGSQVRLEVAQRLISTSIDDAVREHSINIVGAPKVDIGSLEPEKELEFTADISVFPEPEIKAYDTFSVSVPKREVTDEDVSRVINGMRESKSTPKKIESRTTAQNGDVIDASLAVKLEGEEEGRPEPLVVGLGEGRLPADLEAGIVGMEVGQTKEIVSIIPADHPTASLRGKEAHYHVTLNGLSEKLLPELDDDFAKAMELSVATVLELRLKVRDELEKESEREAKQDVQVAVLDQLVSAHQFQVPQVLIDDEIRSLLARNGLVDSQGDIRNLDIEPYRAGLGEVAEKRVRTAVLVDRIGDKEAIKASNEEVDAWIKDIADKNQLPLEDVKRFFLKEGKSMQIILEITRNKVLELLTSRAKVEYTKKGAEAPKEAGTAA